MPKPIRRTITPAKKARGTLDGGRRKIAIGFPKELFDQINQLATTNKRSFREQTIVLCESAMKRAFSSRVAGSYQVRVG